MNCEQNQELLLAYLDGELTVEERSEIKTHLAQCPACSAEIEALTALQADLTATVGAVGATIQLPPAAEARIAGQLETRLQKAQAPTPLTALRSWLRSRSWVLAGALAALLVVILAGEILYRGILPGPTPEPQEIAVTQIAQGAIMSAPTWTAAPQIVEKEVTTIVETEGEVVVTQVIVEKVIVEAHPTATPMGTATPPVEEPAADMFFENYGVNPFIDTEDDQLSTFALDVDTGSYTLARRYVRDGYLPPGDAVRIEEFVNYFDQGYDYPPEHRAFAIHVDGAPSPFAETERYQMMRVGIQGYTVSPEERRDVALTFVIDVSGSMDMENRLELVKRSLELLVEQLRPTDSVGIVVYGSEARVVLEPTSGANQEAILRAIYSLHPEGSTNAEAGLRMGYRMANRAFDPKGINRVILCSDGVANVGRTGPDSILEVIGERAREGITLTTVGFGMGNYNDVLMEQLADNGDGFYAYVDTLQEANRLFTQNLVSTLQTIARNAKVQVEFNPDVVSRYRLVGFENRAVADEDFRDDSVDAGEIGAGHSVTALYEFKPHHSAQGRIATVYLRWEDPETGEVVELRQEFYSDEVALSFAAASPYFQNAVVVAEYAEVLRGSYWAEGSTLAGVLEEAERVAQLLPKDPDVAEFAELVRRASRIAGGN